MLNYNNNALTSMPFTRDGILQLQKYSRTGFAILLLMLTACSSQQSVQPEAEKTQLTETSNQQSKKIDEQKFLQGLSALKNNDLANARRLFKEFIRSYPDLSGAYINLALIHFKHNNDEQSLKLVNKALKLNPGQSAAYHLRAQLNVKNGKIIAAKNDYIKAIELKPEYINAQYNLALLYDIYLQEITLAIKHYEIYMSLIDKPDEPTQEWINHLKGTLKNG